MNFDKCCSYEESQQGKADRFYNSLGATKIERCLWSDPHGKELQKQDIDVVVDFYNSPGSIKISEKFHRKDYNNIMFELWSNIANDTPGSTIISQADEIYYFTDTTCYTVDRKVLQDLAVHIKNIISNDEGDLKAFLTDSNYTRNKVSITYKGYDIPINLYKIKSTRKSGKGFFTNVTGKEIEWYGITATIELSYLSLLTDYRKYNIH